jgi:hypothetical protein
MVFRGVFAAHRQAVLIERGLAFVPAFPAEFYAVFHARVVVWHWSLLGQSKSRP